MAWAYVLVVLNAVLPIGATASAWVVLATGPSLAASLPLVGPLAFLLLGVWRVIAVVRDPLVLERPGTHQPALRRMRRFGRLLIVIGAPFALLNLLSWPLFDLGLLGVAPAFFVLGVYLSALATIGLFGLLILELGRLRGFELAPAPLPIDLRSGGVSDAR